MNTIKMFGYVLLFNLSLVGLFALPMNSWWRAIPYAGTTIWAGITYEMIRVRK